MRFFKLLFPVSIILLFSCRKEKADWDSDWVVPLVKDTLDLSSLVNDSTIVVNSFSNYELDLTRTIKEFSLADFVAISDTTILQDYILAVPSVTIPPGFTIVNQIEEHTLEADGMQLKKIRVKEGVIKVKVFNPLYTKAYFSVKLPGVTLDGNEFQQNYFVPAATSSGPGLTEASLDVSGYWIDLTGEVGSGYNILQSQLVVTSDPAGPTVTLTNSDVIKVEAQFKNIIIDYARGYFNRLIEETLEFDLDLMSLVESGMIDLPATSIRLELENGLKVGAKATIQSLQNTNNQGNTEQLTSGQIGNPFYIDPATGSWGTLVPGNEQLIFDSGNSNVEAYLENLGKTHSLGYSIQLSPWGNVSGGWDEIFPNSKLKLKVHAQMPLSVQMDDLTLRDTFDIDLKQDNQKTHVVSGDIVLNATNAFPFQGDVTLLLLAANGALVHSVQGTQPVESSQYGTYDLNLELYKRNSEVHFPLPESVIAELETIKKVVVKVKLNTPNAAGVNSMLSIPDGAFMSVKLKAFFRLNTVL